MEHKIGLTKHSLIAALTAAYAGSWFLFVIDLSWRIQSGADARICPVGSQHFTDWCTIAEASGAFLLVFLWALYALPFALAVTVIPALALGRLSLIFERKTNDPKLGMAQYALASTVGIIAMLLLAKVTGVAFDVTSGTAGLVGAIVGVWGFRRTRYRQQTTNR